MLHDISFLQNDGSSPLLRAARNGHEAVVALLLSKGADVNQASNRGQKPIDVADTQKIKDMVIAHIKREQEEEEEECEYSQGFYDEDDDFEVEEEQEGQVVAEQHQPKAEAASNGQAVPTMMDELQWFQAAEQGDLAPIQQGIEDKIDVNCQDSKGRTAVYWAAEKGHLQLVEYLITQHADLNIANVSGGDVLLSLTTLTPLAPTLMLLLCTITPPPPKHLP